jgi:glycosyltransferase involved in cell wall biosynthesis
MKIGFDAKRLYNNFTGLGNYARSLLLNLLDNYPENQYFLYTPKMKTSPETQSFLQHPDLQTHLPKALIKSYWRTYSIIHQLKKDKIDLYHGLSNELPVNIDKHAIKSVVTIHDLIFKIYPQTYPLADRFIYDMKFRYACAHANRIIAVSECTKNDIVNFYHTDPDKIEVIYQSCDPLYYKAAGADEISSVRQRYGLPEDFLLYVGTLSERKNLLNLIRSYDILPPELRIPLVVVGRGEKYRDEAQRLIQKQNQESLFIWIDSLSDNLELRALYTCAKAFIYPSLYEGFGIPVVEALLCHTPVITSSAAALPEAGGPGSMYADPNDPAQIADSIGKVLHDNEFRRKMIETGYQYASLTFDSRRLTEQLMNSYQKI